MRPRTATPRSTGRTVGVAPGCIIHAVKVLNRNNKFVTSVHGSSAFNGLQWVLRHYNEVRPIAQTPPPPLSGVQC